MQRMGEALDLAQTLPQPINLAFVLSFSLRLHIHHQEGQIVQEQAETVMALSNEQGFPQWGAYATIYRGWARVAQGYGAEGIAQMHQGLADWRATGTELGRPTALALLAEAYGTIGQPAKGLARLNEALEIIDPTHERVYEAEIHRLRGELRLKQGGHNGPDSPLAVVESCFRQAIALARQQGAKLWELRATMSLSRLLAAQGKPDLARPLLAEIYNWFSEGFDTPDLIAAKALLDTLSANRDLPPDRKPK